MGMVSSRKVVITDSIHKASNVSSGASGSDSSHPCQGDGSRPHADSDTAALASYALIQALHWDLAFVRFYMLDASGPCIASAVLLS